MPWKPRWRRYLNRYLYSLRLPVGVYRITARDGSVTTLSMNSRGQVLAFLSMVKARKVEVRVSSRTGIPHVLAPGFFPSRDEAARQADTEWQTLPRMPMCLRSFPGFHKTLPTFINQGTGPLDMWHMEGVDSTRQHGEWFESAPYRGRLVHTDDSWWVQNSADEDAWPLEDVENGPLSAEDEQLIADETADAINLTLARLFVRLGPPPLSSSGDLAPVSNGDGGTAQ